MFHYLHFTPVKSLQQKSALLTLLINTFIIHIDVLCDQFDVFSLTCLSHITQSFSGVPQSMSYEGFWLGTLAQCRMKTGLCALFKEYYGERSWKAIHDRLWKSSYLSRVDHVWKIKDRKQRKDIGKYSFVNRTIKNWNQLPAETLGTFPYKPKIFCNRLRKAIINGVKWKE